MTDLTPRQRAVVERFLQGRSVSAIATELRCSERTVRAHLAAVAAELPGPHTPLRRILIYGPALLSEAG